MTDNSAAPGAAPTPCPAASRPPARHAGRPMRIVLTTLLGGALATALGCAVLSGDTSSGTPWVVWALHDGEQSQPDGRTDSKWERVAVMPGSAHDAFEITTWGSSHIGDATMGHRRLHQSIGTDDRYVVPVGWLLEKESRSYLDAEFAAVDVDGRHWVPFTLSLPRLAAAEPSLRVAGTWEFVEDLVLDVKDTGTETTHVTLDVDGTATGHVFGVAGGPAHWALRGNVLAIDWPRRDWPKLGWQVRMLLLSEDDRSCVGRGPHLAPMRGRRTDR